MPDNEWSVITLPFSEFKAHYRGKPIPDAEPLDTSQITQIGIQVPGGVYSEFKQSGAATLEIDFMQAYE